ncbi:hypothetical protein K435DRAFT_785221 [Dendrothele bispora CBS 962.96]|uniref:Uncharacterized protein n=1 Tax=Dendrothele bispora (strain CBS 962.96) TaxID=1314807 RepID=A0A4S8KYF4_DENBC|nr:hypothetical protein K435DRAFT_785221 [Dendrothele bispora CBS 962.96]
MLASLSKRVGQEDMDDKWETTVKKLLLLLNGLEARVLRSWRRKERSVFRRSFFWCGTWPRRHNRGQVCF